MAVICKTRSTTGILLAVKRKIYFQDRRGFNVSAKDSSLLLDLKDDERNTINYEKVERCFRQNVEKEALINFRAVKGGHVLSDRCENEVHVITNVEASVFLLPIL